MDNLYKTLVRIKLNESEISKKNLNYGETSTFKYEIKEQNFSKDFDIQKILIQTKNTEVFDMKIKNYCLNNKKNIDSLLLLRCRVSHAILANIKSIWYENNTNVTFMDLLSIFMEDPGNRYLLLKKKKGKEKREFNYLLIEELDKIHRVQNPHAKQNNPQAHPSTVQCPQWPLPAESTLDQPEQIYNWCV